MPGNVVDRVGGADSSAAMPRGAEVADAGAAAMQPLNAGQDPPLPAIESLTIESDFTGFMRPGVDDELKRGALKKLFRDPRFNVMDGLDVYIDDYSKPDPIDPALVRTLVQARYIFDPPPTRVTPDGFAEDAPPADPGAAASVESIAQPALPATDVPASPTKAIVAHPDAITVERADGPPPTRDSDDSAQASDADRASIDIGAAPKARP